MKALFCSIHIHSVRALDTVVAVLKSPNFIHLQVCLFPWEEQPLYESRGRGITVTLLLCLFSTKISLHSDLPQQDAFVGLLVSLLLLPHRGWRRRVCVGQCARGVKHMCVCGRVELGVHLLKKVLIPMGGTEANKASDVTQWELAW